MLGQQRRTVNFGIVAAGFGTTAGAVIAAIAAPVGKPATASTIMRCYMSQLLFR